jgi:hypothetical protein
MTSPLREPVRRPRKTPAEIIALYPCAYCGKPSTRISQMLSPGKELVEVGFCTKHHKISTDAWVRRRKILNFLKKMRLHPCVIEAMMGANIETSIEHGLP